MSTGAETRVTTGARRSRRICANLPRREKGDGTQQPTIAIVTDDLYEVDLVDAMLVDVGYENNDWFKSIDAYQRCRCEQPAMVILCVCDTGAHQGWRVLEVLHAEPATASIPVVVCTDVVGRC